MMLIMNAADPDAASDRDADGQAGLVADTLREMDLVPRRFWN
jgi:hypothetical protein